MIENLLKQYWPISLGKSRFGVSKIDNPPVSIIHHITTTQGNKDQDKYRYQADVYLATINHNVKDLIQSINIPGYTLLFVSFNYEYVEDLKLYRHITEFIITST